MRSLSVRPLHRPVRRTAVAAVPRPGALLAPARRTAVLAPESSSGLRHTFLAIAAAVFLAGGYLALDVTGDVLRYRIEQERGAIEQLDERLRTVEAKIDEARRLLPLRDGTLDLLLAP
jgi:hypothetical protein